MISTPFEELSHSGLSLLALEVYRDGKTLLHFSREEKRYPIYSITKSVTSAAFSLARDDGLIEPDTRLSELMTQKYRTAMPQGAAQLPLSRLLTMRAGKLPFRAEGENWTEYIFSLDIDYSDDRYCYSNIPAYLVGAAVENAIGGDLPKYLKISPLEIEVITPTRQFELGSVELNKKLQKCLNPPAPDKREKERGECIFREGDKVMQIKNNYKIEWSVFSGKNRSGLIDQGIGVFNGDMGIVSEINDFDERVVVTFDDGRVAEYEYSMLDELEHAFAITVHKSQGSEYPAVVIPILSGPPKLFNRNLLYTAVTRARRMVVIVGNLNKINEMIDNIQEQKRYTSFKTRIQEFASTSEEEEYMSLFDEDMILEDLGGSYFDDEE